MDLHFKAGPIQFKLGSKVETKELGATGTQIFGGFISGEEYNPDLEGAAGRLVYDRMRKSDGQTVAAIRVCVLPLLRAIHEVEPASDKPKDREVAEFIEANLFGGMTVTWDNFMRQALTLMLTFGFCPFEKVFENRDDMIAWRKLAVRLPKTLHRWHLDEDGGLAGFDQIVMKGGEQNQTFEFITIPVEKLVIFVNEQEGQNFEGMSLLRPAYKHWYYKDNLYRIDAIANERHGVGMPVGYYPSSLDENDPNVKKLTTLLKNLQAHERSYLALPDTYKADFMAMGSGRLKDTIKSIEHHDKLIARSILAQFLTLGADKTGSYALSRDQSSFFLMSLQALATNFTDTMNRYAIKQLVDYNYQVDEYPKLTITGLATREVEQYAKAVTDFVNARVITPDADLETHVREVFELPEKLIKKESPAPDTPPSDITPEPPDTTPPLEPQEDDDELSDPPMFGYRDPWNWDGAHEFQTRRQLTACEKHVSFADINRDLDDAVGDFIGAAEIAKDKQIKKLVELSLKLIQRGDTKKVDDLDVPYKGEVAAAVTNVLQDLFVKGRESVKKELVSQKNIGLPAITYVDGPVRMASKRPPPGMDEPMGEQEAKTIRDFLRAKGKASVSVMAVKLKSAATFEILRQMKDGILDEAAIKERLTALSDRELKATAQASVNEAFNLGRANSAKIASESIASVQYSAILDDGTCTICEPLDGEEWAYSDSRTATYEGGNPNCEGQSRCRCILVFVGKAEGERRI